MKARLIAARPIAPYTSHFEFEALNWDAAFVPGQFLSITQTIGEDAITRAYSIAFPRHPMAAISLYAPTWLRTADYALPLRDEARR